jgi:demethoxyubiquinone hydroxylase (CLK1/Coq7/Cat5 family)
MIKTRNNLATLVYTKAIEDRVKSKYLKRIDYLVNANNELMRELEDYNFLCENWKKDML